VKLTKTGIAKLTLKAQPAIHWDDELGGFGLRIYPSGAAAYVVDYRLKGSRKKRRVVLGKVAELTPQMARERAKAIKSAARNGVDLDQETRAQVAQRELEERRKGDAMTVVEAVAAYLEAFELETSKRSGRRPTASSVRATGVQLHRLLAIHGDKALEELTMRDVQAVLEATPQSSRRNVFGAIARLFAWARRQGIVTASPLERIDSPAAPASRDRTPSPSEVRSILKATDNLLASGKLHQAQRDGIWLCALTAQRRGEVATMTWEDVDFEAAEWRQPGSRNKTGKPHSVPLGPHALELLKLRWEAAGRPSEGLVLPGVRYGGRIDSNLGDWVKPLVRATGVEFRLHDFRRSAVSAMAESGVDFAVADSLLNHSASESRGGMLRVYQRAELKGAKQRAMAVWEAALFGDPRIPESGGNVIPLRTVVAS
jgi:integrase